MPGLKLGPPACPTDATKHESRFPFHFAPPSTKIRSRSFDCAEEAFGHTKNRSAPAEKAK
jgi:hypothetical protein